MINTHELYDTIDHEHVDVYCAEGCCSLMVVACRDGRWYLEDQFGDWSQQSTVASPGGEPFCDPRFFTCRNDALDHAAELVGARFGAGSKKEFLKRYLFR